MKKKLHRIPLLRRVALPLLKATAFDFSMPHPYVGSVRVRLNSYLHKGYWFHRKDRERTSMTLFAELLAPGMHVVEVGGHIGFLSAHFMNLVGRGGKLSVFEPGSNNLPYTRVNLERAHKALGTPYRLHEVAVGPELGEIEFYEDNITGQNNSAVADFDVLQTNAQRAFADAATRTRRVEVTTLDHMFADERVDFIKVDVEGFEGAVVQGALQLIEKQRPMLMVEVQSSEEYLLETFTRLGYRMFRDTRKPVRSTADMRSNMFLLHTEAHAPALARVFGA